MTTQQQPNIQKYESKVVRDEVVKQMEAMQTSKFVQLPENYKESAFFALEKLANLQDIEKVPAIGITKALISMFSNRLDYRKNHCYFFVQNDKNTGKSLRFGWQYQGLIHVAKETCNVREVTPVLVYEADEFSTRYELGALVIEKHIPTFEGEIKGGYCVISFKDHGGHVVKYFTKKELDKRRDKSMAKNGQFWNWEREMYEKTIINASLKRLVETSGEVDNEILYNEPEGNRGVIDAVIIQQSEPASNEPEKFLI
jgi:recombinational DNA repair protein RecT